MWESDFINGLKNFLLDVFTFFTLRNVHEVQVCNTQTGNDFQLRENV